MVHQSETRAAQGQGPETEDEIPELNLGEARRLQRRRLGARDVQGPEPERDLFQQPPRLPRDRNELLRTIHLLSRQDIIDSSHLLQSYGELVDVLARRDWWENMANRDPEVRQAIDGAHRRAREASNRPDPRQRQTHQQRLAALQQEYRWMDMDY